VSTDRLLGTLFGGVTDYKPKICSCVVAMAGVVLGECLCLIAATITRVWFKGERKGL